MKDLILIALNWIFSDEKRTSLFGLSLVIEFWMWKEVCM